MADEFPASASEKRWAVFSDRFGQHEWRIRRSENPFERTNAIKAFLGVAERLLSTGNNKDDLQAFHEVAHLLGRRYCDDEIWQWLGPIISSADRRRRRMMECSFIRMIPEKPVIKSDLERLWDLFPNRRSRWTLSVAYKGRPKQFLADYKRIKRWPKPPGSPREKIKQSQVLAFAERLKGS